MTKLLEIEEYIDDLRYISQLPLPYEKMKGSSIMVSGATGMIGSFLIDSIMYMNRESNLGCHIYALGRTRQKAQSRFVSYFGDSDFTFIECDLNDSKCQDVFPQTVDYIFHAASNTHPVAYSKYPIETITTNVIGTNNLLSYACAAGCRRFVFASSNEIYGENRGDTELFDEQYCGYINSNTLRAGYPESKRCGEALCQAYMSQKGLDIVIPRFTRTYGPTMLMSDTKAISQFIKKALAGEDIVLKSEGNQYYSYTYAGDAVSGLLTVLLLGETGEAYNISHISSDIRLRDLAQLIASQAGKKVVFELPDEVERRGYSTATKARLDGTKISTLGWSPRYSCISGITKTLDVLKEVL